MAAYQEQATPAHQVDSACKVDLASSGQMQDILSNALVQGLNVPEMEVDVFLLDAEEKFATGPALLEATAAHFRLDASVLTAEVEKYKHINCVHCREVAGTPQAAPQRDDGPTVSAFARDVTLHVVLHELGHALIREFDIPILANEETSADAFATYYLTTYMPDRAVDVLRARTMSLMIEAGETPEVEWRGEHDDDARRAFQIAALAMAADPLRYKAVAAVVGMSEEDIGKARDYGAEILRSWRRVLGPLLMPEGVASTEARVRFDPDIGFINRLCGPLEASNSLASEIESAVKRFDWHSMVTVQFVDGKGGAAWSRSSRTITVHSEYVRRFIEQGHRAMP